MDMVMKIRNISFVLYLFLVQCGDTQSFQQVNAADVGFIEERLARIDRLITQSINDGEIPGAVALVARNGKIAYHKSFGYADVASKRTMDNSAIFRIASMTKAITTVGVMILHERGHFMLNDPISKYIPEFESPEILIKVDALGNIVKTEPSKKEIKIIDLLTHSSGISYPFIKNDLQNIYQNSGIIDGATSAEINLESQMKLLSTLPLLFEPGAKFQYGLSLDLLGYLCEVISGKPLDRYLNDEIFSPLKMYDTHFYLPDQKKVRLVTLYSWIAGKGLIVSKGDESSIKLVNPNFPIEGEKTYFSGGAGLSSTAYDYGRFIQMLLNNGELEGADIISRKSVELMRRSRIDWDDDGQPEFGLGFYIINDIAEVGELGSDNSYSWGGAFNTSYWIDPQENLIGIFMSQTRPTETDVKDKFRSLVYQALE